jgi:hypothetical protein
MSESKTKRDPEYLANLQKRAEALRQASKNGKVPPPALASLPASESEERKEIRRLEAALGLTSSVDCRHAETQQFTEICMQCWRNVYESDCQRLEYLVREFDRRVAALEAELNINQIEYW